jgi:hypothetical protein
MTNALAYYENRTKKFYKHWALVFPPNVRLDWKVIANYKHSSLFGLIDNDEEKNGL